jgi:hypothetical protein
MERADVAYDARQDRKLRYSTFTTAGSLAVPHTIVQQRLASFLERRGSGKPLLLYVNFHDTHYPYHHSAMQPLVSDRILPEGEIQPSRASAVQEMYFNAAANVDQAIGATVRMVEQHLGSPPGVIVASDHGESLFDEGFLGHGYALNETQTRIPLIIKGVPLHVTEPFGQAELRDAIGEALSRSPSTGAGPRVTPDEAKTVFQYLGNIDKPRQIALVSMRGRTIYDFRNRRWQAPDGRTYRADDPEARDSAEFLRIIRLWERMIVARSPR